MECKPWFSTKLNPRPYIDGEEIWLPEKEFADWTGHIAEVYDHAEFKGTVIFIPNVRPEKLFK